MGLCPSRNNKQSTKFVEGKTYTPERSLTPSALRADAAAFVPVPEVEKVKAPWELFLEQKRDQINQAPRSQAPFLRRGDGTFTAEYRQLLEKTDRSPPKLGRAPPGLGPPATGAVSEDVMRSWKEAGKPRATKPKVQKTNSQKKDKERPVDPLRAAMARSKLGQPSKEEVLAQLEAPAQQASDDLSCAAREHRYVPFGLSDRHYMSAEEDHADAQVHRSLKPPPQREYVSTHVTAELEDTITEVLYKLRLLNSAKVLADPAASRRYCVGLREVQRASKDPSTLKAVIVAPDLETGSVDDKLQNLLQACKSNRTPVVFGLSRLRLGQAIKKNVTISVLGILDTRGVQEPFDQMLELAR